MLDAQAVLITAIVILLTPFAIKLLRGLLCDLLRSVGLLQMAVCTGKSVLITGCDSGFGQRLAHAARTAGFEVIAACYTEEGAQHFRGERMSTVVADLTTDEGCARVVAAAEDAAGPRGLYALVNNAGLCMPGSVDWLPARAYTESMALNFHAPVSLTYGLLPSLKAAHGRVINVTSVDGYVPLPNNAAYNTSKHALEAYSDTLRCEMLPWKVKVVVIEPATMRTPLAMSFPDRWLNMFSEADPLRTAAYGGHEWGEAVAALTRAGLESIAADPQETVGALMQALTLSEPPSRITTGRAAKLFFTPLSWLPDATRDRTLYRLFCNWPPPAALAQSRLLPPPGVVSHVTIRVRRLATSLSWYRKLGFECVGPVVGGQQFLTPGMSATRWRTLVLLQEDRTMAARGKCYDAGMTRLCICVISLRASVRRLSALGLEPIAPPAAGRAERVAAYEDPDGFMVYLIAFHMPLAPFVWLSRVWNRVHDPMLLHWTINMTDVDAGLAAFDALGFQTVVERPMSEIKKDIDVFPAFGLSSTTTDIKHARLVKLPADTFLMCIMQWVEPRTTPIGAELLNSMSMAVDDVDAALHQASAAGLRTLPPERRTYPALGAALVGTVLVDGGSRVEFVRFAPAPLPGR